MVVSTRSRDPALVSERYEIDLRVAIARLWARRWWIISFTVLSSTCFAAAAFLIPPVYRAAVVLLPASTNHSNAGYLNSALGQLGGLAALAGIDVGSQSAETEEDLAVLRSREFTEAFIRSENLMPKLFPKKWNPQTQSWKGSKDDWPTYAEGFNYFDKKIRTVTYDKKTGLITLQIDWRDPQEAAAWANGLAARLNKEMRSRVISDSTAAVAYLKEELATTTAVDTRQAINRLIEAQINRRMLANVTAEYAFRIVDRAMAPDRKDMVTPKKGVLLILGPILGLMFGSMLVLVLGGEYAAYARPLPNLRSQGK